MSIKKISSAYASKRKRGRGREDIYLCFVLKAACSSKKKKKKKYVVVPKFKKCG